VPSRYPLLLWAGFLAVLTATQLAFKGNTYQWALLGGACVGVLVLALLARATRGPREVRALPDISYPTVAATLGACAAITGMKLGAWLYGIGIGLFVIGIGGVVREVLAERRMR
jgi:hypothetical protein